MPIPDVVDSGEIDEGSEVINEEDKNEQIVGDLVEEEIEKEVNEEEEEEEGNEEEEGD